MGFSDGYAPGIINTNPTTSTNASSENIDYINYLQHIDFNIKMLQTKNKYIGSSNDLKSQFLYPEALLNISYIQNNDFFNEKKFGFVVNAAENTQSSVSQFINSYKNKVAFVLIKNNLHSEIIKYINKNNFDTDMKFFLFKNLYLNSYSLNYSVQSLPIVKASFSSEDLTIGNLMTGISNSVTTYPFVIKDYDNSMIGLNKSKIVSLSSAPKTFTASIKESANRCGASKKTIVRSSNLSFSNVANRAPAVRGGKPSNEKRSVGSPESATDMVTALGPGITETSIPSAIASRINLKPGSLIVGIPASETTNTVAPLFSSEISSRVRSSSFPSKKDKTRAVKVTSMSAHNR